MNIIVYVIVVFIIAIWLTALWMARESAVVRRRMTVREQAHAAARAMAKEQKFRRPLVYKSQDTARSFLPSAVNMAVRSGA